MKRRNLLGILAGTTSGFIVTGTAHAGEKGLNRNNSFSSHIIFASQAGANLDSNVISGGGTDDTDIIQALLDKAPVMGSLHLVMDGAALIRGLTIYSNTTIECLNSSCGFFLAPHANRSLIQNANPLMSGEREDKNITLLGGTYNHNCKEQAHHIIENGIEKWVIGMEFYGVENFTMRDLTIMDQRTFAMLFGNWFRVTMENISVDLPGHMDKENQDGIHFFGPGQFLTMRNIQGRSGDDFIALAPDESDGVSDITDVIIDGVFLNNADQGIRLLTKGKGRLDRVIIKNITGTYRSFGFYIDPWFKGCKGNFGNIIFDTVNLAQSEPNYDYTTPFLFRLGGEIENLVLKNIYHNNPFDSRPLIDIGWPTPDEHHDSSNTHVQSLLIDGLRIFESDDKSSDANYIHAMAPVDNMVVRNVEVIRPSGKTPKGCLLKTSNDAVIKTLVMSNIYISGMDSLLLHKGSVIGTIQLSNLLGEETGEAFLCIENGTVHRVKTNGIFGTKLVKASENAKIEEVSGNIE